MLIGSTVVTAFLLAGAQAAPAEAVPAGQNARVQEASALSSEDLGNGKVTAAIVALEKQLKKTPEDPALLINLGIAHAQAGSVETARAMFSRALASPNPIELETADGRATDSRRLARKAIKMLDRGEFAPRLSQRD